MRIAIAGGHGAIALRLTRLLTERGETVQSLVRNPVHEPEVREHGGEPVRVDLEAMEHHEITGAIEGADAIVFAAGAGPGSGAQRKETVDYGAAVKMIEVARALSIPRYLMISSMGADADHPGEEVFDVYLRAKGRADRELIASGLDYTICRPGSLTDDPGTGRVTLGESVPRGRIPRDDVAEVLATCLLTEVGTNRVFEVVGGEIAIGEALAQLPPAQA